MDVAEVMSAPGPRLDGRANRSGHLFSTAIANPIILHLPYRHSPFAYLRDDSLPRDMDEMLVDRLAQIEHNVG